MADVQIVTVTLSDGTSVQVVAGTPLHELYLALAGFTTTSDGGPSDIDLRTVRTMAWFMTPHGPQSVVEPATITEFRRRDYAEITAQQAADFFAGAVEIPDVSFITGQELPAAMAAAAVDDDSPFAVGLRAAYGRPAPSGITGTGNYDSIRNLYNAKSTNLAKTRAAVARAIAGTGFFKLLCLGDSTTEGVGSEANPSVRSYPVYLSKLLQGRGVPSGGTGWVIPHNNNNNNDSRWATTGSFGGFDDPLSQFIMATSASSTATFTSDVAGTVAEIATLGPSGPFTITVDGATPANGSVTVSGGGSYSGGTVTPGGAQVVVVLTVTGLSNVTHTIVATTTSSSNTYILGAQVRSATSGLLVTNAGVGTSQTADWLPSAAFFKPGNTSKGMVTPDLTLISLGINDGFVPATPTPVATYQANLAEIVAAYQALGDVILKVPPTPTTAAYAGHTVSAATWATYRQAAYTVADSADVPLLDVGDRWGPWTSATALGYMYDELHPSAAGYAAWAQADLAAVLA